MSKQILDLTNQLRSLYTEEQPDNLSELIGIQIAIGVAHSLKVPANSLGSATAAWGLVRDDVRKFLDEVNETFVIDITAVTTMVKEIYSGMYNLVHAPNFAIKEVYAIAEAYADRADKGSVVIGEIQALTTFNAVCTQINSIFKSKEAATD